MHLTTMKLTDVERYIPVFLSAFTGEPWNEPWTREAARTRLEQFLSPVHAFGLALEERGEVIAFVLGRYEAYFDGMRFFIEELCCSRRGEGHGTRLLRALEEKLWEQGVVRISLMTIHGDATEGYYARRGYAAEAENLWMYKQREL